MSPRLRPIGRVVTNASREELRHGCAISRVIIDQKYVRGLEGLQQYSHIYVLFWLHEVSEKNKTLKVHPRGRADIRKVGVFSTRSPQRPNPIGLTLVRLMSKRGRSLTVRGLDAYEGTPVLDIKPYDNWDHIHRPRVPAWWRRLQRERRHKSRLGTNN